MHAYTYVQHLSFFRIHAEISTLPNQYLNSSRIINVKFAEVEVENAFCRAEKMIYTNDRLPAETA